MLRATREPKCYLLVLEKMLTTGRGSVEVIRRLIPFTLEETPMTRWTTWIIGLVLCGCATWPVAVTSLKPGENIGPSENLAVVTGRILQVEDGTEQNMRPPWYEYEPPRLNLYRVENRQWYLSATVADKDGNFYWLLPRGTYVMADYGYRGMGPIVLRTAFQVPPGLGVVYVGTLRIEMNTVHGFLYLGRARLGRERIAVLDEFEQARTALETRNPPVAQQVSKHIMVYDLLLALSPRAPNWQSLIGVLKELGFEILTTAH
jgi:hypothetical protein